MKRNPLSTQQMTEIALLLSLALVIELIFGVFPRQPQGGSISLSLLPLIIITYRQGIKTGVAAGAVFGVLNLLLTPVLYHWASLFLDYLFAFGFVALAGLLFHINRKSTILFVSALGLGGLIRFAFHFISGVVLFGEFAPEGQSVWEYSLVYNGIYMIPTIVLLMLVGLPFFLIMKEQLNRNLNQ